MNWFIENRNTGERRFFYKLAAARKAQARLGVRNWRVKHGEGESEGSLPPHVPAIVAAVAETEQTTERLPRRSFDYRLSPCVLLLASVCKDRWPDRNKGLRFFGRILGMARAFERGAA